MGVPIRWTGDLADLPAGYTGTIRRAAEGRERAEPPDTFVICGAIVRPGQGLAGQFLTALCELAPQGCQRILAPVRPTLKPACPLIPIETFARGTRGDGAPSIPGCAPTGGSAARSSPPHRNRSR